MYYVKTDRSHVWRSSSFKLAVMCACGLLLGTLMALSSVELLSVRCDRGEDRCKVVNVTLWEGREVREFALSQVASYDRGYSISSRRSRSQRYTTIYEQPVVVLEDGRKLALKRTERKVFMETNTFLDLKHYFGDRSQVDFKGRDVFAGIWFFAGVILCALLLLVGMLAIRYVRLEIDQEASELRFTRVGVFSPMRFKGGPGEVAMCVLQPDPQTASPGVYLYTRDQRWLAVSFHTSFIETQTFEQLQQVLAQTGIACVTAEQCQLRPAIDYRGVFFGFGLLAAGSVAFVVCGVIVSLLLMG